MSIRVGNGKLAERAVIDDIREASPGASWFDQSEYDEQMDAHFKDPENNKRYKYAAVPGVLVLDRYLQKLHKGGDSVRDNLAPMADVFTYTLVMKDEFISSNVKLTKDLVLKKSVKLDYGYSKGQGYLVGEQGLTDFSVDCNITFREAFPLLEPQVPTGVAPHDMQFACLKVNETLIEDTIKKITHLKGASKKVARGVKK